MKYTVLIKSRNPSPTAPIIKMEWKNKAKGGKGAFGECLISDSGVYRELPYIPDALIEGQEKDRAKIVKINLNMVKSTGDKKFWEREIVYYDTTEEAIKNGFTKDENNNNKLLVNALKKHFEISFKSENNTELNPNIDSILVKYNLLDTTERLKKSVEKKVYVIEATSLVYDWFKNDQYKLTTFGFLWGIKEIETMSADKLFDVLITEVSNDINKFNDTLSYIESDIHTNIIKATRIVKGTDLILKREGNYFMFNNNVVAEGLTIESCIEKAVAYFKVHSQDYVLLKNELGVNDGIPTFVLEPSEEPSEKKEIGIKRLGKNPHQEKQEAALKRKVANLIYKVVIENKDVIAPKNGVAYALLSDTGNSIDSCLKDLSEVEEIKDSVDMQVFFREETDRVKTERTPYNK